MTRKKPQPYIICATPRSGSTLLCDLLTATGIAGCPDSFFRRESFSGWAEFFHVSAKAWDGEGVFDQAYLDAVVQEGYDGTPVFGMRLMWESLADLSERLDFFYPGLPGDRARLEAAFGPLVYVHLSRKDKVAQAVSRLRAEQTGLWHRHADGTERERMKPDGPATYDAVKIARYVSESDADDAAWNGWFAEQNIVPVSITYENLSCDPQGVLAILLKALGLDQSVSKCVQPKTAKLANAKSEDWIVRFRSEKKQEMA